MYVAGVLMQLCCGALMWVGPVDALSYNIVVIKVLRGYIFLFSPIVVGTQRTALIGRVTHPVVECVCPLIDRSHPFKT